MTAVNSNIGSATDVATQLIINVSTAEGLYAALENAKGGETILLEAGNYGNLTLKSIKNPYVSEVTIKSVDVDDPAVFNVVKLNGVSNLTFDTVVFDFVAEEGAPSHLTAFTAYYSDHIVVKNSVFDGDVAKGLGVNSDGYATGKGIMIGYSSDIVLENNEFDEFIVGGKFLEVDGLTVTNNDVHDIRSDGFDFIAVNNVLIEGNYIHDFRGSAGSGDHMDMIQFWTANTTTPTTDVIIRDNFLDSGQGSETQSIFMRNEMVGSGKAGSELFYQNITIENNIILNSHTHGITVGETDGLTISNNTILYNQDSAEHGPDFVPTIHVYDASLNVTVANNIVPVLNLVSSENLTVENNLVVQREDSESPNYIGDLFINGLADSQAELSDLAGKPGGLIENLGVGSSLAAFDVSDGEVGGFIVDETGSGVDRLSVSFDATNLFDVSGQLNTDTATIEWDFGDGSTGNSLVMDHAYQKSGTFNVTATVTLETGDVITVFKTVDVETPVALFANFNDNAGDLSDDSHSYSVGDDVSFENARDGQAVRLNSDFIAYGKSDKFIGNSEYSVSFDFKKDDGQEDASGRVITLGSGFTINIEKDGVSASITTTNGKEYIKNSHVGIDDDEWHQVTLTFSGNTGSANLYVDGQIVGTIDDLDGAIQKGSASQPFYIGNPWGKSFPGLIDNVQFVRGVLEVKDGYFPLPTDEAVDDVVDETVDDVVDETVDDVVDETVDDVVDETDPEVVDDDTSDEPSLLLLLEGTSGNDRLRGTDGDDLIRGVGGKDFIYGGDGDDVLFAGDVNYGQLHGGFGDDILNGGDASDTLFGGDGNDILSGNGGNNKLIGGNGADILMGGASRDRLFGDAGNDKTNIITN